MTFRPESARRHTKKNCWSVCRPRDVPDERARCLRRLALPCARRRTRARESLKEMSLEIGVVSPRCEEKNKSRAQASMSGEGEDPEIETLRASCPRQRDSVEFRKGFGRGLRRRNAGSNAPSPRPWRVKTFPSRPRRRVAEFFEREDIFRPPDAENATARGLRR